MKWALVLSGGGAKGLAHIGLIKELERRGEAAPGLVAGASMGAIIGGLYALGWDSERLAEYAAAFDLRKLLENPAFRLPDFALSRLLQAGTSLPSVLRKGSLDSGARVDAELRRLFGDVRIEDLGVPFLCTATDLVTGESVVQDSGPLADAVRASMAFPGVFAPVRRGDRLLVDGGILDNMPCALARARGFRRVLASDVSPWKPAEPGSLDNGVGILWRCFDVASNYAQAGNYEAADLVVASDDGRGLFDFGNPLAAVAAGQASAAGASGELDRFFAPGPFRALSRIAKLFAWKRSPER